MLGNKHWLSVTSDVLDPAIFGCGVTHMLYISTSISCCVQRDSIRITSEKKKQCLHRTKKRHEPRDALLHCRKYGDDTITQSNIFLRTLRCCDLLGFAFVECAQLRTHNAVSQKKESLRCP